LGQFQIQDVPNVPGPVGRFKVPGSMFQGWNEKLLPDELFQLFKSFPDLHYDVALTYG
jgi:hypothetical protein